MSSVGERVVNTTTRERRVDSLLHISHHQSTSGLASVRRHSTAPTLVDNDVDLTVNIALMDIKFDRFASRHATNFTYDVSHAKDDIHEQSSKHPVP